ncbi:MAG: carbohydrate binding family 9 domain-containing protein, partial [Gemmatimonadales bacterium]
MKSAAPSTPRAAVLATLVLLAGAPASGRAQTVRPQGSPTARGTLEDPEAYPRPVGSAVRVEVPPRLDGRLDDPAWTGAPVFTDFIQSQPEPGALATQRSEVRVVYDRESLYIGAMLYDDRAGEYVIQSLERDFPSLSTRDADIFGVALDTFLDRRNSYILLINPYGAYRDGQTFNDSRNTDFGFDAPTEVRT